MAACFNSVRKAILDDVSKTIADGRYTISRVQDDTFQINNRIDNIKSKAKSNNQAFKIAEEIIDRVKREYFGHVNGYINQPSPYEPLSITFLPSDSYIQHELDKYNSKIRNIISYPSEVGEITYKVDNNGDIILQPPNTGKLLQTSNIQSSKVGEKTLKAVSEFLERNKIDVKSINSQFGGRNGVADLLNNIIYLAEGKENVTLTEEAAHFAVEMIEQSNPKLFNRMLNKIGNYKLYQEVFNEYSKEYKNEDGAPDVRKIKKEAIGKVLAEYIALKEDRYLEKPENIAQVQNWWSQILEWVKNMLKIASFNPFEQAAEQFNTLTGEVSSNEQYFQLSPIQEQYRTAILETENNVRKNEIPAIGNKQDADDEDSNWYEAKQQDGTWKRIIHRVTNRALSFKQRLFGKKEFTEDEQKYNNALRNRGVDGHKDMENIINRYIDASTGQKKQTPDPFPLASQIMPNDRKMDAYKMMDNYVRNLIDSFPDGSVFIPEAIIFDSQYKDGGEAGTVDLIVIEPSGKTNIFDWKFMGNNKNDIAGWKQGAFNIQIGRYKEILRNRYGVKEFGMTRAIPIMMDVKLYRTLKSATYSLNGISVGNADPKNITEIKLLPVPTEDENTGIDVIDKQLNKLRALGIKFKEWEVRDEDTKTIKRQILDSLRLAVRALQTQQNVVPMVEGAENIYIPSVEATLEDYEEFMKLDKSAPSDKEISDMSSEIDDAISMASVYEGMAIDFDELVEDEELKKKMSSLATQVVKNRQKLEKARKLLANKFIGERNDILDIFKPEKVIKGISKIFSSSSQLPMRTVEAMVKLYRNAVFTAQDKSLKFNERVKAITDRIKDKKQVYSLIFKKDSNGKRIHELVNQFDEQFTKKLHSLTGNELVKFLKENINYDEYLKDATDTLQGIIDKTVESPNTENYIDKQTAKYIPSHPNFSAQNALIYKYIDSKWESNEYKQLKQNKDALELYNLARELGKRAAEIGYIDYMEQYRFLPFFRKGFIDKLFTGGHISPIQDTIDGLSTSHTLYGEIDPISGEKRYSIPKYGRTDISVEKTDEQGKTYRDYSDVSDDIGRILVGFSMEIERWDALNDIVGQVNSLRHLEQFKGHIRTNKANEIQRDERDAAIIDGIDQATGNAENLGVFEAIEQYLIYGNKYPLTSADADTGLGKAVNGMKHFMNNISNKISGRTIFPEEQDPAPSSVVKAIESLNRMTQMKILGLSPLPSLANFAGLQIQMASQAGRFYSFPEWIASEKDILSLKFASREQKELMAQLYHSFLPLVEDPNRHLWKQVGMNKIEGNSLQDFLFIGFQKPEFLAQAATFISLLKNSTVKDGKIVPITDLVQQEYADKPYQEYVKEKSDRIAELKKNSIWNTKKLVDGKLEIPGFDMENIKERQKLGLQARAISKSISGNMSEEDVSRASMDIFFKSIMVFKNWIPKLVETRFGGLKRSNEYYDKNYFDIGKVRLFWHVFMEHAKFRFSAIGNIRKANDNGMNELEKLYSHYKTQYENTHDEEFTMDRAKFYDMVRRNLNNQVRELKLLFSMLGLMMTIGFMEPPEDKQQKAVFNTSKRIIDQIINELSFFYMPTNWQDILSQGMFPGLSMITDAEKFITNLSSQITGMDFKPSTEGEDEVRKAAQPVKYLFKMFPVLRQGVNYMTLFSPEMAKDMDINVPPADNY